MSSENNEQFVVTTRGQFFLNKLKKVFHPRAGVVSVGSRFEVDGSREGVKTKEVGLLCSKLDIDTRD